MNEKFGGALKGYLVAIDDSASTPILLATCCLNRRFFEVQCNFWIQKHESVIRAPEYWAERPAF